MTESNKNTVKKLTEGIYHIQTAGKSTGMLSRYGLLNDDAVGAYAKSSVEIEKDNVILHGSKRDVSVKITGMRNTGYRLDIPLSERERLFGLGDANRDNVMIRGKTIGVWVCNVISYGPLPIVLSSDGWAILVNSTFRQKFDLGDTDKDMMSIYVAEGEPDFYLFAADSLKETIGALTEVTGRPSMLPAFAYGLTFVENEKLTGAGELLDDIKKMRDAGIPCDVFGLEPSWMETYYDFSTEKKWDPERFYLNYWRPLNDSNVGTFFAPMRFMGMQLSLWLCEDYDLFYEEERQARSNESASGIADMTPDEEAFQRYMGFQDKHLVGRVMDLKKHTKPEEAWFEHLKKFVDNGAACFKLDGSNQVLEHPQRAWAEKFLDKEAHNIYPVILAKQMSLGYREHTDRRSMIYSAGGYVGIQKYAATWAGDTGGGKGTLVSCMNYAMCGHTNTSCDMDTYSPASVHYGFLQSWSQINSWASYRYPWYYEKKTFEMLKSYSLLRSSLFPYIYSTAHNAYKTGIPILRPLVLAFEDDERYDDVQNAYMLGDDLYVGAFDMDLKLPRGKWVDYFTGKIYEGDIHYEIPEGKGGALFARAGSIIGTMKPQLYINECEHDYVIKVFPGGDARFELYEDDGFSLGYENGEGATTLFEMNNNVDGFDFTVNMREGSFDGRPDNGHDILNNSIPKIEGMKPLRDIEVEICDSRVASVTLDGVEAELFRHSDTVSFSVPAALHSDKKLVYKIVLNH